MMNKFIIARLFVCTLSAICLLRHASAASAVAVCAQTCKLNDGLTEAIEIRNGICRLVFVPQKSGICVSYEVKDGDFVFGHQPDAEFLREVFNHAGMKKTGADIPFTCNILSNTPNAVTLEFRATLSAKNADESVAGVEFTRRVTLNADSRHVTVSQEMVNTTKDLIDAQVGVRQRFFLDAVKQGETYFLPADRNILRIVEGGIDNFYAKMNDWEYRPVEGWMAAINPRNRTGIVFVMDQNTVDCFYTHNATGASGWFVDGGVLDPGASFTTCYTVIPVRGFGGVVHASRRLIADARAESVGASVEITHSLAGAVALLGDVTVKTSVYTVRSKERFDLPDVVLHNVGTDPVSAKVIFSRPQEEPLVVRVQTVGRDWQESYETYHEGEFRQTIYPGYPYAPEYKRTKGKGGK